jgi:pantothenate kinase, type III
MLLAVDIGNTNITIGVYDGEQLLFTARAATDPNRTGDQYAVEIMGIFSLYQCDSSHIDGVIVSSVAPAVTNAICGAVKKTVGKEPILVGPGIKTGLNIAINDPAELGADLLCASVAALHKYPLPNAVCDLGTASTIFVLDKDGKMIGGIIYPGIRTSLMALVNNAALLPQISYEKPKQVIGKNTIDCMRSGLILGAASLLDGMLERVEEELQMPVTAIATGGFSADIIRNCKRDFILDEDLVLEGLRILYDKNSKSKNRI